MTYNSERKKTEIIAPNDTAVTTSNTITTKSSQYFQQNLGAIYTLSTKQ
jgi:hypothetical protein